MKVIDLLNMISKGEEVPKKIKYKGHIYQYQYKDTKEANIINYYHSEETHHHLIDGGWHDIRLNDEVEILEEDKKIKRLPTNDGMVYATDGEMTLAVNKINEMIDKINKMENK